MDNLASSGMQVRHVQAAGHECEQALRHGVAVVDCGLVVQIDLQ